MPHGHPSPWGMTCSSKAAIGPPMLTGHLSIALFAAATLAPVPLIAGAALWGGWWVVAALGYLVVLTAALDAMVSYVTPATTGEEFPTARMLTTALGLIHFALLALVVWALPIAATSVPEKLGAFLAAGLFFGQVSNANAHELIHRPGRFMHKLGMWVYVSLLFGHHTSAHPLVHHIHVGTRADPSTARRGENFYRFARRAWKGSFRKGWQAESLRSARIDRPWWGHPYVIYATGGALCAGFALVMAGGPGLLVYLVLAFMAQSQLLMSDYVQHYGLMRRIIDGRPEPIGPQHSWNSPHILSSALTMNAPRHSDHHTNPNRTYSALTLPIGVPTLPRSLPVMAFVALYPPRWRRMMDPLAAKWQSTTDDDKFMVS